MAEFIDATAAAPAAADRWSFSRYLLVFLAGVIFFIGFDLADGRLHNGDTDDLLRALEIRAFLTSGNWFDLSFPSVRMPDVYVTPWSRLVDIPYMCIAFVLQRFVGQERALVIAFNAWPMAMALLYAVLVVSILRRIAPSRSMLPLSALLGIVVLSTYAIWEFSPGRIDHHNVQILLLLAMIYGICRWDRLGGLICGAIAPVVIAVGLETLPLTAATLLALVVIWMLGFAGSRRFLQSTGLACVLVTLVVAAAVIRPAEYFVPHNDAFSAPYIEALVGYGLLAMVLPAILGRDRLSIAGGALFAVLGLAVLAVITWQYPTVLDGPLPMITGLAKTYWFARIDQEKSAALLFAQGDYQAIIRLVLMAVVLILAAPSAIKSWRSGQPVLPIVYVIGCVALLQVIASNRSLRLALAIVPLLIPFAVECLAQARFSRSMPRTISAALAMVVAGSAALAAFAPKPPDQDAFDFLVGNDCRDKDFSALSKLSPGRISTPPALGLQIIADQHPGISVSSISFHRSAAAISENLRLFMTSDTKARAALLKGFDYLAVCRSPVDIAGADKLPLYVDLMRGTPVPGLVALTTSGDLMLYRIDDAVVSP